MEQLKLEDIVGYLPSLEFQYPGGYMSAPYKGKYLSEKTSASQLVRVKDGTITINYFNTGVITEMSIAKRNSNHKFTYCLGKKGEYSKTGNYSLNQLKPLLLPMTKEVLEEVFKERISVDPLFNVDSILKTNTNNLRKWIIDLFNKHHVDYMDLIGRGLALDKTKIK